jgi:hypothetical protein
MHQKLSPSGFTTDVCAPPGMLKWQACEPTLQQ